MLLETNSDFSRQHSLALAGQQILLQISRMRSDDMDSFMRQALELDAKILQIKRVSLWWLHNQDEEMVCACCIDHSLHRQFRQGDLLRKCAYPKYFGALAENRNLAVNDARNDPRTSEFCIDYLIPLDILSMLDIPIRRNGKIIGVICHESIGQPHHWTQFEQDFAAQVADLIAVMQENAEHRKAESALRESEMFLRRAQAIAHLGCWNVALPSGQMYWSDEMCSIFGLDNQSPPAQLSDVVDMVCAEDKPAYRQLLDDVAAGKTSPEFEMRIIRADGAARTVRVHSAEVEYNVAGEACRVFGTIQDMTEQRHTQEALHKSEERMRLFFERQIVGMAITAPNHRWLQFNDRLCQMFGYSRNEMAAKNWPELLSEEAVETYQQRFQMLAEGKINSFSLELKCYKADRTPIFTIFSVGCVRHADNSLDYVLSLVEDITARKSAELELEGLNAAKDKFFSIIAHDLKSMFHAILGFSNLLKDELHTGNFDSIKFYTENINSAAYQTYNILTGLLDWANSRRGLIPFAPEELILGDLLNDELELLKEVAGRKGISVVSSLPEGFTVNADANMLKLILRNLIANAIKFTRRDGKIVVEGQRREGNLVEIIVCDNGIGMSQQTISQLFKIDMAMSSAGTDNEKGSGLGLLLCAEFVKKHGGKIWAESELGQGSSFHFTLPQ